MPFLNQIDCFNSNMGFWKFLGIWPARNTGNYYKYYMIGFFMIFCVSYDLLLTINFFYMPRQLDRFIEEMIFYFTELAVLSKVVTFLVMHNEIEEVLEMLQSDYFQPNTQDESLIIEKAKKFNIRYYNIVKVVSLVSHLTHILSPLVAHLFLHVPLALPVCSYSFLSEETKTTYAYPLYFYQSFGMHFHMWYNVNIDTFFLGLMVLLIAQLNILDGKLRKVTDKDNDASIVVGSEILNRRRINDEVLKLNQSVKHFDELGRFCSLLQNVFSVTLFVQFSMASSIICVCLFRFVLPAPFQYYIFLTMYMFIMIIQILVPCWFGTRIIDKSNALTHSVYDCNWTNKSRGFKMNMRVFIERTTRPLIIIGGKMFPLSLKTFTSIINTAYSFFTLLRHMQNNHH